MELEVLEGSTNGTTRVQQYEVLLIFTKKIKISYYRCKKDRILEMMGEENIGIISKKNKLGISIGVV
jgi:hypothetical protein